MVCCFTGTHVVQAFCPVDLLEVPILSLLLKKKKRSSGTETGNTIEIKIWGVHAIYSTILYIT